MTTEIAPLFDHLRPLESAVAELANTWHPEDPAYRAELYRQIMMNLSFGYFVSKPCTLSPLRSVPSPTTARRCS